MKRDMDLIRVIVLDLREHDEYNAVDFYTRMESCSNREQLKEHLILLEEAGYVQSEADEGGYCVFLRLTWNGHEFADNVSNSSVWDNTKAKVKKAGGGVSFEIIKSIAAELVKGLVF